MLSDLFINLKELGFTLLGILECRNNGKMGSGTMEECFNRIRNREHPNKINIPLFHYSIYAIN